MNIPRQPRGTPRFHETPMTDEDRRQHSVFDSDLSQSPVQVQQQMGGYGNALRRSNSPSVTNTSGGGPSHFSWMSGKTNSGSSTTGGGGGTGHGSVGRSSSGGRSSSMPKRFNIAEHLPGPSVYTEKPDYQKQLEALRVREQDAALEIARQQRQQDEELIREKHLHESRSNTSRHSEVSNAELLSAIAGDTSIRYQSNMSEDTASGAPTEAESVAYSSFRGAMEHYAGLQTNRMVMEQQKEEEKAAQRRNEEANQELREVRHVVEHQSLYQLNHFPSALDPAQQKKREKIRRQEAAAKVDAQYTPKSHLYDRSGTPNPEPPDIGEVFRPQRGLEFRPHQDNSSSSPKRGGAAPSPGRRDPKAFDPGLAEPKDDYFDSIPEESKQESFYKWLAVGTKTVPQYVESMGKVCEASPDPNAAPLPALSDGEENAAFERRRTSTIFRAAGLVPSQSMESPSGSLGQRGSSPQGANCAIADLTGQLSGAKPVRRWNPKPLAPEDSTNIVAARFRSDQEEHDSDDDLDFETSQSKSESDSSPSPRRVMRTSSSPLTKKPKDKAHPLVLFSERAESHHRHQMRNQELAWQRVEEEQKQRADAVIVEEGMGLAGNEGMGHGIQGEGIPKRDPEWLKTMTIPMSKKFTVAPTSIYAEDDGENDPNRNISNKYGAPIGQTGWEKRQAPEREEMLETNRWGNAKGIHERAVAASAGVVVMQKRPEVPAPVPLQTVPSGYAHADIGCTSTTYHHSSNLFAATMGSRAYYDPQHPSNDPRVDKGNIAEWLDTWGKDVPTHRRQGTEGAPPMARVTASHIQGSSAVPTDMKKATSRSEIGPAPVAPNSLLQSLHTESHGWNQQTPRQFNSSPVRVSQDRHFL